MSFIVFILSFSILIPVNKTYAIGVIGSNAVKQSVLATWEKAGINYTTKEAKERAFEAWNMKAYEKWRADEVAGRNQEYWNNVNSMLEGKNSPVKTPVDNVEGFGKVLLDWTFVGLAVSLGNEVAKEMEQATLDAKRMGYLGQTIPNYEGISLNPNLNIKEVRNGDYSKVYYITGSDGVEKIIRSVKSPYKNDSDIGLWATSIDYDTKTQKHIVRFDYISKYDNGGLITGTVPVVLPLNLSDVNKYEMIPKPEHLPFVNIPQPLQDLSSNPYDSPIPEHLPQVVPLEVNVPLDESLWEGTINVPYEIPDKPPVPEKPPVTTPTPGQDPNKKPLPEIVPEPGSIKDPFEQPKEIKEENLSCERVQRPDFKPLGNAFTTSFPFSLPWDLKRYLDASFSGIGDAKPKFDLPFFGEGVAITIPDELDKYVSFFRGFILIVFDISIIYLFVRVMRGGSD